MQALNSHRLLRIVPSKSINRLHRFFSSLSETLNPNPSLVNYLTETLNFSKTRAESILTSRPYINTVEKPQYVIRFFENLGFSRAQIRYAVNAALQILHSKVEKTLKPKIEYFQKLGLAGSDLGDFISKNSTLLTVSLEKRTIPRSQILKNILSTDKNNKDLIGLINRSNWILFGPQSRLLTNIEFFKSCGIVGSQLSMLLKRQPRIFVMPESQLQKLVSRVLDMGFSVSSRMLVHGIYAVSCLSAERLERKMAAVRSFGYSEKECIEMFRKAPVLMKTSENKINLGIIFFLEVIKCEKLVLVNFPWILMLSMEERVIPRYRVLQVLESKGLVKTEPIYVKALRLTDEEFLEKFVARFKNHREELLVAYNIHKLDSSEEEEAEES